MKNPSKRVLVLGASGMLGNATFRVFAQSPGFEAFGSVRTAKTLNFFPPLTHARIISGVDVENFDSLQNLFRDVQPDFVINCVGIIKQLAKSNDVLSIVPINSLLPHRLAQLCAIHNARLVHISTDCVFSGSKGMYVESDNADATDLYGRSKYLGEVSEPHTITLRTSIIGHEFDGTNGLLGWFLAQQGRVQGYRRAIFSGLPTVEIARVIRDFIIPRPELFGLYHVSAEPISKFELLKLIAKIYKKSIEIEPDDHVVIDRSLDSTQFRLKTSFQPSPWPKLLQAMYEFYGR